MLRLFCLLTLAASCPLASSAADAAKGRDLARQCAVCHGRDGISKDPEAPNLAGQPVLYLEKSLTDYREGRREDRRMTLIAAPLSDADIKDLAAWYASIKLTAELPQSD